MTDPRLRQFVLSSGTGTETVVLSVISSGIHSVLAVPASRAPRAARKPPWSWVPQRARRLPWSGSTGGTPLVLGMQRGWNDPLSTANRPHGLGQRFSQRGSHCFADSDKLANSESPHEAGIDPQHCAPNSPEQ
jgi:hypothetical protein